MNVDKKNSKTMAWVFFIALIMGAFMVFVVVAGRATQLNEQEIQKLQQQRSDQANLKANEAEPAPEEPRSPEATGEKLEPSADLPEEHETSN